MLVEETFALLGYQVKCRVTGFEGVVSSISFDLYGCVQAVVTPPSYVDKDGATQMSQGHYIDVKRLMVGACVMVAPRFETVVFGAEIGPAEKPAPRS